MTKWRFVRACFPWCLLPVVGQGATVPVVAIRDAHVVTVSGADLPKATVVLRDGLIQEIGPSVTVPAGASLIEGAGLTVYPGFIDGWSTWGIPNANPAPAAAGTGQVPAPAPSPTAPVAARIVHGPEDRPQTFAFERAADLVSPADKRLEAARAAGYTSAATFPNKGIVEGLGAVVNLAGERAGDMVVAQPVGETIAFRIGGGGMGRSFPSSLMGNIAYVRQLYLDLDQYKRAKQAYAAHPAGLRRPDYDHDLEALGEAPRLLLPADEVQQIDRMGRFGKELKVPFVLYGLHEGFERVNELKSAGAALLVSLKWPEKAKDADPTDVPNYRQLVMRAQAPALPGELAKAGVKFAFYSDGTDSAPDLKKAVKKAMDAGLDRSQAVRALTLSVAEMYGVADRMGSLEKGKIANVVIMRGDAFEENSTVEYVFIDGKQFQPSKDLQTTPAARGEGTRRAPAAEEGRE